MTTNIVRISTGKEPTPTLIDVLAKLMQQANINISQLSKNTGLANTTVKRMCTDPNCNPTITSINKIADFFGVSTNQILGNEPLPNDLIGSYYPQQDKWLSIPIISLEHVLQWPNNIEEVRQDMNVRYVKTDIDVNEKVFAVFAEGEALEPKFSEETILIFDPERTPTNKCYAILLLPGKSLPQFRQLYVDGPDIYIKLINPVLQDNSPVLLDEENSKILGILIQAKSTYVDVP
jgi:SOS-response transcriptional repressor LexA